MLITHRAQYISIFKTQVGGKEERSDKRERAVDDRLMTERERALHSFWQMKALRWCENNIPSRILETVVPIIVSVSLLMKNLGIYSIYNGAAPQRLWSLWGLVVYAVRMWKLQESGVSAIFLRVTSCRLCFCKFTYIFDLLDSAKYCSTVVVVQLRQKVTFWKPRTQQYLLVLAVLSHSNWISFRRPEM